MVHRREIDGQEIVLGNQGDLWNNALTFYDHETGSVWSQPLGEAILGPLTGTRLELLPSTLTTWQDWQTTYPETWALDAPSGLSDVSPDELAVVVELGDASAAFPIPELREAGVANVEVDGTPLAIVFRDGASGGGAGSWRAFFRRIDDRVVDLTIVDGSLVEIDGDGRWRFEDGLGVDGTGQVLDRFSASTSFPADYRVFHPDGSIWNGTELVPVG